MLAAAKFLLARKKKRSKGGGYSPPPAVHGVNELVGASDDEKSGTTGRVPLFSVPLSSNRDINPHICGYIRGFAYR